MHKRSLSTSTILLLTLLLNSLFAISQTADTITNNNEDTIYETVDTAASFPGGKTAWNKFIEKNIDPIVPVENGAKKGTYKVKISFTVTKDGTLKDFESVTKHKHGMKDEVIRVLKLSPKWIPARKNGNSVNSKVIQEQTFVIMTG